MEPALACVAALWSPSTGIVDSHGCMTALLGDAERAGAVLALLTPLLDARRHGDAWRIATGGAEALELEAALGRQCRRPACAVGRGAACKAFRKRRCRRCISPRATTSRCAAARRSRA